MDLEKINPRSQDTVMDLREKEEDQGVIIVNISGPIEASKGEVMKMMKPTRVCVIPENT